VHKYNFELVISRRDLLIRASAAGAANLLRPVTDAFAAASQPNTPVNFKVPPGACDCHVHIFGDPQRFPFAPTRTYTPEAATVDELRNVHRALHLDRVVVIQASVYGTDNSCTLDAIKQLGPRARGIAVIDEKTSAAELDRMNRGGIRGVRINLGTAGQDDPAYARDRLLKTLKQIGGRPWHIQMYVALQVIAAIEKQLTTATVPIVFDHFGGAKAVLGVQQPGMTSLLRLLQTGKAYVKISGAYRASSAPDYQDAAPLAKVFVAANPERVLWGSDWPHPDTATGREPTDVSPLLPIDDGRMLNFFASWVPNAAKRKMILVDNPAKLYAF
jgi:predicted TIM-barrel fold metal-dependent hydrolase